MQEVGEAMGRVGSALGQYVLQRQNDLNEAQALDAFNQAERITQERVNEYEALSSLNAIRDSRFGEEGPISYYTSELSRAYNDITGGLNANVQERLRPRLFALQTRASDQLNRHFNAQSTAFETETYETSRAQAQQTMIASPDNPEVVSESIARIVTATNRLGAMQGQDPETISLNTRNAISEAIATTHAGLLDSNNIPAAERFLEQYQSQFQPDALVEARSTQRQAGAVFYGRQIADQILRDIPVTRDDNRARDRDAAALAAATIDGVVDEDRLDAARTLLNRAVSAAESDIAANDVRLQDELIALAATNPAEALRRLPTSGLSVTAQEYIRSQARRTTGEAAQPSQEQYDAYLNFVKSIPDLTTVTPQQLNELRSQIGETWYGYLREDITEAVRIRRLGESATIRAADRDSLMTTLDIDPDDRAAFEVRARQLIGVEQARLGRELTDAEKRAAVLSGFGTNPTVTVGPTNLFGGGQRRQLGLLSEEERAQVVVPSRDRRRIEAAINGVYQDFQTAIRNERDPESRQRLEEEAEIYNVQTNPGLVTQAYIRELETGLQATGR
jgi:hypothetical protein